MTEDRKNQELIGLCYVVIIIGGLWVLFSGCAPAKPLLIGCLDQKPYVVEGPVIINKSDVIFHDETGKLHKVEGTCGIKAVREN